MSIENPFFEGSVAPQSTPASVDAFEAALAASPVTTTVEEPVVETIVADQEAGTQSLSKRLTKKSLLK